jgi:hypothetical protein
MEDKMHLTRSEVLTAALLKIQALLTGKQFPVFLRTIKPSSSGHYDPSKGLDLFIGNFSILIYPLPLPLPGSRENIVSIATRLQDRQFGVRNPCSSKFCSEKCADWFWGPPSLLVNRYQGALSPGVKLTIYLHLVPRLRMNGAVL